jgi:hypothetical protein
MKNKELIEKLQELDPEAEVYYGDCNGYKIAHFDPEESYTTNSDCYSLEGEDVAPLDKKEWLEYTGYDEEDYEEWIESKPVKIILI